VDADDGYGGRNWTRGFLWDDTKPGLRLKPGTFRLPRLLRAFQVGYLIAGKCARKNATTAWFMRAWNATRSKPGASTQISGATCVNAGPQGARKAKCAAPGTAWNSGGGDKVRSTAAIGQRLRGVVMTGEPAADAVRDYHQRQVLARHRAIPRARDGLGVDTDFARRCGTGRSNQPRKRRAGSVGRDINALETGRLRRGRGEQAEQAGEGEAAQTAGHGWAPVGDGNKGIGASGKLRLRT